MIIVNSNIMENEKSQGQICGDTEAENDTNARQLWLWLNIRDILNATYKVA